MTAILNELIDQRLSELTGSSTGKSTLLWEKDVLVNGTNEQIETTIQVENLDKYKYLFIETYMEMNSDFWLPSSAEMSGGSILIPMQVIKNDNTNYHSDVYACMVKYVDNSNLKIMCLDSSKDYAWKLKIYGIE